MRILYINAIETNAGWGAECFVNRGLRVLGHTTTCIDYRKNRSTLHQALQEAPEYDIFFLQRGDFFPMDIIRSTGRPRLFWASELVSRCRDQDRLLVSGLFDHIFFHSRACAETAVSKEWVQRGSCSVLLNGFDETIHRPVSGAPKDIDILFAGSMTVRRSRILGEIRRHFPVHTASAFGQDLVALLNRSKIVLNIHAEDFPDTETRVFETLGCGGFVLSERLSQENPFTDDHVVQFDSVEELCERISYYLSHDAEREEIASGGHREALRKHTYTHRAAEIAKVMESCICRKSPPEIAGATPDLSCPAPRPSRIPRILEDKGGLRIFAAVSQNNWEDHNLLPALRSFGQVVRYDWRPRYDQYDQKWHWGQKQQMNMELLNSVHQAHKGAPLDLFFGYLSGRLVFPSTIRTIGMMGIPSLNICLDDRTKFYGPLEPTGFAGMVDIAGAFSLCWTTEEGALERYRQVGARAVYMPPGANPEVFRPYDLPRDIAVCFVGQNYGRRSEVISFLRRQGIEVRTFGSGWDSGEIGTREMVRLFSRSRITLGMGLVGDSPDVLCIKGRDFEVPMSRGFYLTQCHPGLDGCFEIGKEIACYLDMGDLAEKIRHFLAHPEEAEAIREAGHRRALREHSWTQRFQRALSMLGVLPADGRIPEKKGEAPAMQVNTRDDWTYYLRVGKDNADKKKRFIRDFVLSRKDQIRFLLDVGCNTGEISAQFIAEGVRVVGLDASTRLRHPDGYTFLQSDVSTSNEVILNDCTLFLSLYHHLFHSLGMDRADRLFYKLLLRSRYLVFDTGTPHEEGKDRGHWLESIRRHFSSEEELLDHFEIPYQAIGTWETGGARRTVVVFERADFDDQALVVDEFRRKVGTTGQPDGLLSVGKGDIPPDCFDQTVFYKLRLGDRSFFAKKHLVQEWERSEIENLIEVYRRFPKEELLEFYGVSDRFGLLYEWVDRFKYLGKVRDERVHGLLLQDADRVEVKGEVKYIDFWSDPAKRSAKTFSPPHPDGSAEGLLREGEAAYAAGDLERAVHFFERILSRMPGHFEAINNLGVIACEKGDLELAVALFLQAHQIHPSHPDAMENLGRCHELKGEYHAALKWYRKVVESGKGSVETLNLAGHCLLQTEDLDGAREVYEESLRRDQTQETVRTILTGIEEVRSMKARPPRPHLKEGAAAVGSGRER